MKWVVCFLIAFSLLISNAYASDIDQQEYMIDKIEKLLNEKPDHWYIRNDRLVYCENKKHIAEISEHSFPESIAYTDIVIAFQIMRAPGESYIKFEKPDLGIVSDRYEHKLFQRIDRIIKIQLYRALKREVGIISDMKENQNKKQVIEVKPMEKEKDEVESNLGKKL